MSKRGHLGLGQLDDPLCSFKALMPQCELHKRPGQLLVQERARCSIQEWRPRILSSSDIALGATKLTTSGADGDAGAALGSAFGGIAQATFGPTGLAVAAPAAYALVGVAGMLAANCQVPLTAVLLLFELTHDYFIIVRPSSLLVIQVQRLAPIKTVYVEWTACDMRHPCIADSIDVSCVRVLLNGCMNPGADAGGGGAVVLDGLAADSGRDLREAASLRWS